jgi:hypothetical protein
MLMKHKIVYLPSFYSNMPIPSSIAIGVCVGVPILASTVILCETLNNLLGDGRELELVKPFKVRTNNRKHVGEAANKLSSRLVRKHTCTYHLCSW